MKCLVRVAVEATKRNHSIRRPIPTATKTEYSVADKSYFDVIWLNVRTSF